MTILLLISFKIKKFKKNSNHKIKASKFMKKKFLKGKLSILFSTTIILKSKPRQFTIIKHNLPLNKLKGCMKNLKIKGSTKLKPTFKLMLTV